MSKPRALKPPKHVPRKPKWIEAAAQQIMRTRFNDAFIFEEIGDVIVKHWPGKRAMMQARRDLMTQGINESV